MSVISELKKLEEYQQDELDNMVEEIKSLRFKFYSEHNLLELSKVDTLSILREALITSRLLYQGKLK